MRRAPVTPATPAPPRVAAAAACRSLAGIALVLGLAGCGESAPARPNLLLVTVDTLRPDRLACYGGPADVGTAICALAAHGTRFEWALAAAPYTAPSIASLLTSLYPSRHGVTQHAVSFLDDRIVSLAEVLREAGYTTAAFVSNPVLEPGRNLGQGFASYDIRLTRRERNRPQLVERTAEDTTSAALAWARVAALPPWFVWVHYQDPHGPYEPPDAPPAREEPGAATLPVLSDQSGYRGIPAYQALPGVFTPEAYERRYLDEIRYLDGEFSRLLEGLDALGQPPAVLLTSDHGEAFGEDDYYFAHGHSLGLDQVRVPLLWRPLRPGPARVEARPVSLLDVAPTLLRLARLDPPEAFRGRPLPLPELGGAPAAGDRPIFLEQSYQAGVVVGDAYYARLRRPGAPRPTDPISGAPAADLPARTARLDPHPEASGAPGYELADGAGAETALEPLLADFLEATEGGGGATPGARTRPALSREARERLRALGYLE